MSYTFPHPVLALAFDLDGTLVHSLPDLVASAQALRQAQALPPLPEAQLRSFVGDGMATFVHRVLSGKHDERADHDRWMQACSFFVRHYRANLCVHSHLYEGIAQGLKQLKTLGLPLAVITNKNEVLATELLTALGIADLFSLIIGGDTLSERKPSPLPLQHTAAILGVEVQNMPLIGDSANDILAAKAAGSPAIAVSYGYGDLDQLNANPTTRPDLVIDQLTELYDHLRSSESRP